MTDIFLEAVNRSIVAGWLVLAVVALRFVLKKAPKWIRLLLWGMVALRLIFPVTIESRFSLIPDAEPLTEGFWGAFSAASFPGGGRGEKGNFPEEKGTPAKNGQTGVPGSEGLDETQGSDTLGSEGLDETQRSGIPGSEGSEGAQGSGIPGSEGPEGTQGSGTPGSEGPEGIQGGGVRGNGLAGNGFSSFPQKWKPDFLLTVVWLSGAGLMIGYALLSYLNLRRRVDMAVLVRDNVFLSERVESPFVLGVIKPKIYIPFQMEEKNQELVILHERTHICRGDHLWKLLGFGLLSLYWFQPLMWLAYVLLCRDIELACDERVIRGLDRERRADYSQTLLDCSVRRKGIRACPLAFGESGVKARVKSVLHYRKPGFWALAGAAAACAAAAVCFLTNPVDSPLRDTLVWA